MKNNKRLLGYIALMGMSSAAFWVLTQSEDKPEDKEQSPLSHQARQDSKSFLSQVRTNGKTKHDTETALILEAFEKQDMELLRERVQQLLDKDFDLALAVFARLDFTLLDYGMDFPHDLVVSYLEDHYDGPESMEILSQYVGTSSITASVMSLYFDQWFERDHIAQFEWFQENSTFSQPTTLHSYTEVLGRSDKGIEILHLIDDLPDTDTRREQAHTATMEFMSSERPELLGEYLNEIEEVPESAYRPIYNMSERIMTGEVADDPLGAMDGATQWIDLVENKHLHLTFLARAASYLNQQDPAMFQHWMADYQFNDEAHKTQFMTAFQEEVLFLQSNQSEAAQKEKMAEINLTEQFEN